MRVLHVGKYFPPERGGTETALYSLARGLLQYPQIELECAVANTSFSNSHELYNGIKVTRLRRLTTFASTPICLGLSRSIQEFKPDLLHIHLPNPIVSVQLAATTLPFVVTYHCDIVRYPSLLKLYSPWLHHFLNKSQKIVVSSDYMIKSSPWIKEFKNKVQVIPLSIDEKPFEKSKSILAEKIKNDHGPKIVLFVGRLVPYKGLNILFEAMKSVDAHLLVIGTGPEERALREVISVNHLSKKITMVGSVSEEDLPAYYQAAQVITLPSLNTSEAFGMTLVEGLAASKPLVTTSLGTGVEFVNLNGTTGLSVEPGNPNQLAEALNRLIRDDVLRVRMGQEARKHFEKTFQLDTIARQHIALYEQILGKTQTQTSSKLAGI